VADFTERFRLKDQATVTSLLFQGSKPECIASDGIPLEEAIISNDWDLSYSRDGELLYSQTVIDADTYQIFAKFPSDSMSFGGVEKRVDFNLTFHRVHGLYGFDDDAEERNTRECYMLSSLWGYNSEIEGTINEGERHYEITRSSRYRGYAAGSWGCMFPTGVPAIQFPWSWLWLIIPGETPAQDIGMAWGYAAFQRGKLLGDVEGGFAAIGFGQTILSARKMIIQNNTMLKMTLLGSSSDGYLVELAVQRLDWSTFTDMFGSVLIPLRQIFTLITKHHSIVVDVTTRPEQYFRAPVFLEGPNATVRVFSDFRAVGVKSHVLIKSRGSTDNVIYNGSVETTNAVEYAYEAEMPQEHLEALYQSKGAKFGQK